MRILVTGATGQLGSDIVKVLGDTHEVHGFSRAELDISDRSALEKVFRELRPHVVYNCAAYTDVDGSEKYPAKADLINATATGHIAELCHQAYAVMIHISSDYVFNGGGPDPYKETDKPDPINAYGRSKLKGEQLVMQAVDEYYIIRTSWLYGAQGKNFVKTILKLTESVNELKIVNDQTGVPTYTLDLAKILVQLVKGKPFGIYNITNTGKCTWYEFAKTVLELKGIKDTEIIPISSAELERLAPRPTYSVLSTEKLSKVGLGIIRPWKAALKDYLENDLK